ncbi:hypothetical protein FRC09_010318 [Ceratobasidium sp. 395]|nr:hypothetical protein FRC09_010318 [Ceratobasidium sp. 395]
MGILSDDGLDFEATMFNLPPPSPTPAAARAQAISTRFSPNTSEFNADAARDYAWMCCEELGLTDTDRDDIVQALQMHHHLIAIRSYARIMALMRDVQRMIVESFLNSSEFKDHITRRIQATFLNPSLLTYVCGSTGRLVLHPKTWQISSVVEANFLPTKACFKVVGIVASNFRGDMLRKIKKSVAEKAPIVTLAEWLCIKNYQPEREHLKRFALMRGYYEEWVRLPCSRDKGRPISFFGFFDSKLDKLRAVCARDTPAKTQNAIKSMLSLALESDKKKYPGGNGLPSKIVLSGWQKDTHAAVQTMSTYHIDAPANGDEEDPNDFEEPDLAILDANETRTAKASSLGHKGIEPQQESAEGSANGAVKPTNNGLEEDGEDSERSGSLAAGAETGSIHEPDSIADASMRVHIAGNTIGAPGRTDNPEEQVAQYVAQHQWSGGSLADRQNQQSTSTSSSPISSATRSKGGPARGGKHLAKSTR